MNAFPPPVGSRTFEASSQNAGTHPVHSGESVNAPLAPARTTSTGTCKRAAARYPWKRRAHVSTSVSASAPMIVCSSMWFGLTSVPPCALRARAGARTYLKTANALAAAAYWAGENVDPLWRCQCRSMHYAHPDKRLPRHAPHPTLPAEPLCLLRDRPRAIQVTHDVHPLCRRRSEWARWREEVRGGQLQRW
jgi:hypothetical protein